MCIGAMTFTPLKTYVRDTWGLLEYPVGWCLRSPQNEEAWPEESLRRFYRSLGEDARVRAIRIESCEHYQGDVFNLAPSSGIVTFTEAISHIRAFRGELGTIVLELELRVFARSKESGPLEMVWVGDRTEGVFSPASQYSQARFWFEIGHTLFRPHSRDGMDNRELARINAPILRGMLERLQQEFGPPSEYEGDGVTSDGFEPPTPEAKETLDD
ncbi:hypothetical protein LZC95_21330 [Pendulispora brunnea]|uniref:Uncharacterized protein n=1 Tax=Pendulispora brunnea TaxID=2905690 RepID=A0ABZ2KSS0_9BACT